jgi:hypothetical protein
MSKELFFQMREAMTYSHEFTKRDAVAQGKELAKQFEDKPLAVSNLARLNEVLITAFNTLKAELDIDKETSVNGVKMQHVQGGAIFNFDEDATWADLNDQINKLKLQIKDREEKLKEAYLNSQKIDNKSKVLDDGEVVEPVSVKGYRKSYIKVTY